MLKLVLFVLKLALTPVLLITLYISLKMFWRETFPFALDSSVRLLLHPYFLAFLCAILGRAVVRRLCRRWNVSDPFDFLDTLEHELTHAFFGYLTFSPPVSLLATLESGGEVTLKRSNVLVALSPYFFPFWGYIALAMGFLVKGSLQSYWHPIPYALLGNFLYRLSIEFRWYQEDLKAYGRIFSTACVGLLLLLSLSLILHGTDVLHLRWAGNIIPELFRIVEFLITE
jgi:hypothetical protein